MVRFFGFQYKRVYAVIILFYCFADASLKGNGMDTSRSVEVNQR